jgi:hypothetical protein
MSLSDVLPSIHPFPPDTGSAAARFDPDRFDPEPVRLRCRAWQHDLVDAEVAYAAPPLTSHLADSLVASGMSVEIRCPIELAIALTAQLPPDRMIGHPRTAMSAGLLKLMRNAGIRRYVVDTPAQLAMLTAWSPGPCRVVLQMAAFWGDTFGDDTLAHATATVVEHPDMRFAGLRATIGDSADAADRPIAAACAHLRRTRAEHGVLGTELHLVSDASGGRIPQALAAATRRALDRHCPPDLDRLAVTHILENLLT